MHHDGGSRLRALPARAAAGLLFALALGSAAAQAPAPAAASGADDRYDRDKVLRVCQDPNNLQIGRASCRERV